MTFLLALTWVFLWAEGDALGVTYVVHDKVMEARRDKAGPA